jgi:hypothetical protein
MVATVKVLMLPLPPFVLHRKSEVAFFAWDECGVLFGITYIVAETFENEYY